MRRVACTFQSAAALSFLFQNVEPYPAIVFSSWPLKRWGFGSYVCCWTPHRINGHFRILNWRYLPYIRPIFQAYVREYPHKIWPEKWYVYVPPSIGSWRSPIDRSLRSQEGDLVFGTVPWMPWMPWMAGKVPPSRMESPEFISHDVVKCT